MSTFYRTEYSKPIGLTTEASTLSINFSNAMDSYVGKSIVIQNKLETQEFKRFLILKEKWESETLFVSNGSLIISNSAYKNIINIGGMAIPWIFREMKKNDNHWFYALEKITGKNPIKNENIGIISKMKDDWLNWGENNNY
jgi:hypothetical protein